MWCRACRQDVPGLASADPGKYSCPRCGVVLDPEPYPAALETPSQDTEPRIVTGPEDQGTGGISPEPPPTYDGWELEERLRHIERLLRIDRPDRRQHRAPASEQRIRLDASQAGPPGWHYPAAMEAKAARRQPADSRSAESWLPTLSWLVLAVGLMASAFGGVLFAWSAASGRQDLWAIGMPVGLGGQIVLVIGLILQLDRLWHDNRHTAEKLDYVDERLHDLNQAATLLRTSYGSRSGPFYADLASSASPRLLLADLKSQLDQLALKLGQEDW